VIGRQRSDAGFPFAFPLSRKTASVPICSDVHFETRPRHRGRVIVIDHAIDHVSGRQSIESDPIDLVNGLRAAGWTDPQIVATVHVTGIFAYMNRVAEAFGLVPPAPK
jgi:alkylhydroperoxidase family enzyme